MDLGNFLVKAKIATYATEGEANERNIEDGAKELTFEEGEFFYRDRYYGFNPFTGEELVFLNDKLIWSMNYFGGITSDIVPAKEVYSFLKSAMREVKEDRPFRGPHFFDDGDFTYVDESRGDINRFLGEERIWFKGKIIYRLDYHGGSM